ncbi:hypothetical protein ACI68E_002318 [Malassezia pachydermatis]|uniref:Pre-rRNA-processing protein RIX1 N-terminal domain-containing protein n=1 Tax=Malassezia pachydermatis TaxID=77020 RepID=A0A0M8MQ78_9BASI|nr:hypothetical protein Malapachy_0882 [Malassezia pachydermatis]KOS14627.1 hypothetical protein Malapachy_0882 [Malassezia pachydermatis]
MASTSGSVPASAAAAAALVHALDTESSFADIAWYADVQLAMQQAALANDSGVLQALEKRMTTLLTTSVAHNETHAAWSHAATLMQMYMDQCGWSIVEAHGSVWVARVHAHLEHTATAPASSAVLASLAPLVRVVTHGMMGIESMAHPEYHRTVVSPFISKMGHAMLSVVEAAWAAWGVHMPETAASALAELLSCVREQLACTPTTYRPHVGKIHTLCMHMLFGSYAASEAAPRDVPAALRASATRLLAQLPITGSASSSMEPTASSGKVSQAQLWAATMTELLEALTLSIMGCAPSLDWRAMGIEAVQGRTPPLAWEVASNDYTVGIPLSWARSRLLLAPGCIVQMYMTQPTKRSVPVPLARCVHLARVLCSVRTSATTVPREQQRLEAQSIVQLRRWGLHWLTCLVETFQQATWRYVYDMDLVSVLCEQAEQACPDERYEVLQTLHSLCASRTTVPLPLDPASTYVQRMASLCTQELRAFLVQTPMAWRVHVPLKRARVFESDAVLHAERVPQDAILVKSDTERLCVAMAASLLAALLPMLVSNAAPGHRDAARLGLLALVGVTEAWIAARLVDGQSASSMQALQTCIASLTQCMVEAHGALIPHTLPRVYAMMQRGRALSLPWIQAACDESLTRLRLLLRPRVPPLVDVVDSSALEERVDVLDAQDTVPLRLAGWRGTQTAREEYAQLRLPSPSPPPLGVAAEPASEPASVQASREEGATPDVAPPRPAQAVAPPRPVVMPPSLPPPPASVPAPRAMSSERVDAEVERAVPALDMEASDEEALPTLHMEASDEEEDPM